MGGQAKRRAVGREPMSEGKACAGGCGKVITDTHSAWCSITGWERPREQGGTNHVALRKQTGEYMCDICMSKFQAGLAPGQGGLL